jgi:hypothetical protein
MMPQFLRLSRRPSRSDWTRPGSARDPKAHRNKPRFFECTELTWVFELTQRVASVLIPLKINNLHGD